MTTSCSVLWWINERHEEEDFILLEETIPGAEQLRYICYDDGAVDGQEFHLRVDLSSFQELQLESIRAFGFCLTASLESSIAYDYYDDSVKILIDNEELIDDRIFKLHTLTEVGQIGWIKGEGSALTNLTSTSNIDLIFKIKDNIDEQIYFLFAFIM